MQTTRYTRKPLIVEAVQMTEENAHELREWCRGELYVARNGRTTLQVKVLHPARPDQTKAQAGDWVLKSDQGFKIYADSAFQKGFDSLEEPAADNQLELTNMGDLLREKLGDPLVYAEIDGKPIIPVPATDALQFRGL
jgi:hypothetical protein